MLGRVKYDMKLNFEIPSLVQGMMEWCEQLDQGEPGSNEELLYDCCAGEELDQVCKTCFLEGNLTKEQWNLICEKYSI